MSTKTINLSPKPLIMSGFDAFKKDWKSWLSVLGIFFALGFLNIGVEKLIPSIGAFSNGFVNIISAILGFRYVQATIAYAKDETKVPQVSAIIPFIKNIHWKHFLYYFVGSFLMGAVVGFGMLFLIVPGIYLMGRLFLVPYYLAEKYSITDSFKVSWELTKEYHIKLLILMMVFMGLIILGTLALGVGVFVSSVIIAIVNARLYVEFSKHTPANIKPLDLCCGNCKDKKKLEEETK